MRARTRTHSLTHTHAGAPSSYQPVLPPPPLPAAAPAWRGGGGEGERGGGGERESERERAIPSSLLSPGSPNCSLDYTVTPAACFCTGTAMFKCGDGPLCVQTATEAKYWVETIRQMGRNRMCAHAADRFHVKVTGKTGKAPKTEADGGMGMLGAPQKQDKLVFTRCVTTRNVPPMFVPT